MNRERAREPAREPAPALAEWLGIDPDPDAPAKVAALEARLGVSLPEDFRAYLVEAAPKVPTDDRHEVSWWSVDGLKSVVEELGERASDPKLVRDLGGEPDKYVFFADFMGWAYAWAICCSDGPGRGRVVLICVGVEKMAARSFSEFVRLALANSDRIHGPNDAWDITTAGTPPPIGLGKRLLRLFLHFVLVVFVSSAAAFLAIFLANSRT